MPSNANAKWSHLPNAVHIDRVLASRELYIEHWNVAQIAISTVKRALARLEARKVAGVEVEWVLVWGAAHDRVWALARQESRKTQEAARHAVWLIGRQAVWDALLCLLAYDDCAHMLDSEVSELTILAALGDQRAILLLPACVAFHSINELPHVN